MPRRTSITYTDDNYDYLKNFAYKSENISDKVNAILEEFRTTKSILENFANELLDLSLDRISDRIDITQKIDLLNQAARNIDVSSAQLQLNTELLQKLEISKTKNWVLYLYAMSRQDLIEFDVYETQQALKQLIEEKKLYYVGPDEYRLVSTALDQHL